MLDYVRVSGVKVALTAPFFIRSGAGDYLLDGQIHSSSIVHLEGHLNCFEWGDGIAGSTSPLRVNYLSPAAPVQIHANLWHCVDGLTIGEPQRELFNECLFEVGVGDAQFRILQQELILRDIRVDVLAHQVGLVGLSVVLCDHKHVLQIYCLSVGGGLGGIGRVPVGLEFLQVV